MNHLTSLRWPTFGFLNLGDSWSESWYWRHVYETYWIYMNVSFYGSAQVQFLYWGLCDNIFHSGSLDSFAYYFNTANQLYSSLTREIYIPRRRLGVQTAPYVAEYWQCGWVLCVWLGKFVVDLISYTIHPSSSALVSQQHEQLEYSNDIHFVCRRFYIINEEI